MEKNGKTGSNFLLQGTILAAAGIIVRLIGLFYKIPMTRILGDEGIGYYNTAYEIYNIGLILSSYSLPLAVSKLISRKEQEGRKKDAGRVFHCGIAIGVFTGGVMTAILVFGANWIASVCFKSPGSALPLRVMAPTILVFAVMGVFRGFFQGHGNMIPTSVSQIVEQIVHAIVSIWASYDFMRRFAETDNPASYGAAGGTLGTLIGALAAMILLVVWFADKKVSLMSKAKKKKRRKKSRKAQTGKKKKQQEKEEASGYGEILTLLLMTFAPIILSQLVYQMSGSVDNSMFGIIMEGKGLSESERLSLLGIYGGKYRLLTNVPVAIASSLGAAMIPSIVTSKVMGLRREVKHKIAITIRFNMLLAIPCAFGMFALASPLLQLLFGDDKELSARLLMLGSSAVIFFSLSTVTNAVLQGIDRMRKSVTHSAISLAIHVVLVYLMLDKLNWGVYGLVVGNVTFALVVCILNWREIGRTLRYRQEVKRTFVFPIIASLIMAGAARLCYEGIYFLSHSNTVAVIIAMILAVLIYLFILLKLRIVRERDMKEMPFGGILLKISRRLS